jgi:hypothetical protein
MKWRRELAAIESVLAGEHRRLTGPDSGGARRRGLEWQALESLRQKLASAENKNLWIFQQGTTADPATRAEFERELLEVERAWKVLQRRWRRAPSFPLARDATGSNGTERTMP